MAPSSKEIEQMAKLKAIMEGKFCDTVMDNIDRPLGEVISETSKAEDPKGTRAMKEILERFYQGLNTCVDNAKETGDRVLTEAARTNPVSNGIQIGKWEIISEVNNGITTYRISKGDSNVASGVSLYESALAMCRLLNNQVSITNSKFIEILSLEAEYVHHRGEAVVFKKKSIARKAEGDYERSDIAEARYLESRANALAIREKIISKSNSY